MDDVLAPTATSRPHESRGAFRVSRRTILLGIVVGVPSSLLFLWLAVRNVDLATVWELVRGANLGWLILGAVGLNATFLFFTLRWRLLLIHLGPTSRVQVGSFIVAGAAINNCVPGRPGEAARAYWAGLKAGAPVASALGTTVVDRACDVLLLVATLLAVLPFVEGPPWVGGLATGGIAICIVIVVALTAAWVLVRRRPPNEAAGASRVFRRHGRAFIDGLAVARPGDLGPLTLLTICAWASFALGMWSCALAVGLTLDVTAVLLLSAVVNLGVAIPSSPGFIGTYQWLTVATLASVGVAHDDAFALSIVAQALSILPVTVVGVVVVARMARTWRPRLRRSPG